MEDQLLANPAFHGQNIYALVMRTLARFEYALGRRVHWGFDGHQLHVAPHAFVDANAFYSREDRALIFGYFRADQEPATSNAEVTSKICHVTRNDRYLLTSCQSQTRRQRRLSLHSSYSDCQTEDHNQPFLGRRLALAIIRARYSGYSRPPTPCSLSSA